MKSRIARTVLVVGIVSLSILALANFARADRAEARTITGTVVNATGQAAKDVPVYLLKPGGANVHGPLKKADGESQAGVPQPEQLLRGPGGGREKVVQHVTTDAAGKFVLSGVAPGKYTLMTGVGKSTVRTEIEVGKTDPPAITIKLPVDC